MAVTRGLFPDLYGPELRKVAFENYSYGGMVYPEVNNIISTERQDLTDYNMAGFGSVPTKAEGTPIVYDDPIPGSTVKFSWTPFGKGFRITHEAQMDELYGQMRKLSASLGRAFKNKEEILGMSVYNDAFAGATFTGFDGLSLCNTAHTNLRGGTQRNRPTTGVDLNVSSLQDAMIDFERFTDHSGVPILVRPAILLTSPEQMPKVQEIFGSSAKPYTADNEVNILQNWLRPVYSHFLTSTDDWFILADKSQHDVQFFVREKFTTDASSDFDTGDGKFKGYMRNGQGFGEWQGVWGSPGTT